MKFKMSIRFSKTFKNRFLESINVAAFVLLGVSFITWSHHPNRSLAVYVVSGLWVLIFGLANLEKYNVDDEDDFDEEYDDE